MTKLLVTGAGGYIGSIATYLLLQKGYQVVGVDNFSTGYRQPLELFKKEFPGKFTYYEADLTKDIEKVFAKEKGISAVLHYAAKCKVDESMQHPEWYFENNVGGSLNLLRVMHENNVNNIVFSSTCAVYGEAQYVPVDEKHPLVPANPYGFSKKIVEEMIDWFGKLKDMKYVILRYFNVCGASTDGKIGDSKKPSVLLVQNAVRGALGIEKFYLTCPVVDTPDKTPIRDYINVVDLNRAHILAVEYLLGGGKSEIVNLGTGHGNSVKEIVNEVQKITGVKFDIGKTEPRQGEYAKMIADIGKAKKIIKWNPKYSVSDSVKSLTLWYKSHPHGWDE